MDPILFAAILAVSLLAVPIEDQAPSPASPQPTQADESKFPKPTVTDRLAIWNQTNEGIRLFESPVEINGHIRSHDTIMAFQTLSKAKLQEVRLSLLYDRATDAWAPTLMVNVYGVDGPIIDPADSAPAEIVLVVDGRRWRGSDSSHWERQRVGADHVDFAAGFFSLSLLARLADAESAAAQVDKMPPIRLSKDLLRASRFLDRVVRDASLMTRLKPFLAPEGKMAYLTISQSEQVLRLWPELSNDGKLSSSQSPAASPKGTAFDFKDPKAKAFEGLRLSRNAGRDGFAFTVGTPWRGNRSLLITAFRQAKEDDWFPALIVSVRTRDAEGRIRPDGGAKTSWFIGKRKYESDRVRLPRSMANVSDESEPALFALQLLGLISHTQATEFHVGGGDSITVPQDAIKALRILDAVTRQSRVSDRLDRLFPQGKQWRVFAWSELDALAGWLAAERELPVSAPASRETH